MTRRRPTNRSQQSLRRPAPERYAVRRLAFDSDGTTCRGTLYLPERPGEPPAIVMAPGFGAERSFGLPAVAERFAEAGYAAFLFDYRHHGDSDGVPRRLVSPARQLADYGAAIDRVRGLDAVHGGRIAVWGHSLSGGHALATAAERADVDAAVALAPFVDGRIFLRTRSPRYLLRATGAGLRDVASGVRGRLRGRLARRLPGGGSAFPEPEPEPGPKPARKRRRAPRRRRVPIVGEADRIAAVTGPGAKRAYLDLVDRDSDWENDTPARALLDLVRYRPVERFDAIRAETFVLVPAGDRIVPPDRTTAAIDRIDGATVVRAPGDHFGSLGEDFEEATGYQLAFLRRALGDPR
ncbi:MAG: alpha/beta fold hydrolase [Haloferacaceae archaeon]